MVSQYNITPINNTIGIYYHEKTDVIVTNDKWTLLVHKNISSLKITFDKNEKILDIILNILDPAIQNMVSFKSEVKTHLSLLTQISNVIQSKFDEVFLDTKRYKRGILNGIGTIFKSITGNLDAEDGEYYSNCIYKLNNDEHQLENLIKNQISVTTSVIKNFNLTIQKLQIDEETFNKDIKEIEKSILSISHDVKSVQTKLKFLEICEQLMASYLYIEDSLNDILNAITFARLKIIHTSIITPIDLITSLQEISQNLHRNNLPLSIKLSKVAQYLDIIELQAFQTDSSLIFVLKIPLVDPQTYTAYQLYPIPILDNRTGLHHILSVSQKYIARDDDSLMFLPIPDLDECKQLYMGTKLCSDLFAYPIDNNAICEARLFKNLMKLPENCQTSLIISQGYNVQKLQENTWLVINAEPLHVTINCPKRNSKTEIITKNSVIKLQPSCYAFVGITKIQASSNEVLDVKDNTHPIQIPYECCNELPDKIHFPELKPLKLNNLNTEDLEIAKHKLDQYSKDLDDLINEPYVTKHISWFTYLTIILIVSLILLYLFCKCRKRSRKLALIHPSHGSPPPPPRPNRTFKTFTSILPPRKRPSIHREEEEPEEIELT